MKSLHLINLTSTLCKILCCFVGVPRCSLNWFYYPGKKVSLYCESLSNYLGSSVCLPGCIEYKVLYAHNLANVLYFPVLIEHSRIHASSGIVKLLSKYVIKPVDG